MKNAVMKFVSDESGATAVEYALIVGIIGAAVLGLGTQFKEGLNALYTNLKTFVSGITFTKDGPQSGTAGTGTGTGTGTDTSSTKTN